MLLEGYMKQKFVTIFRILFLSAFLFGINSGSVFTASAFSYQKLTTLQKRLLSGFADFELNPANATQSGATSSMQAGPQANATNKSSSTGPTAYNPGFNGCAEFNGNNVKVNQNCVNLSDPSLQGRSQSQNETAIALNPNNPKNIVTAYNDYRRGDGTCGVSYSLDGGLTWEDSTTPNGFTSGATFGGVARQYWQAGGDPSVAWDSQGNAYLDCQVFMRGPGTTNNPDASSAIYLFRSTQNNGASFNFTARPVVEDYDTEGATLLDKPYMTVDNHTGSPYQDRVYVTWTLFAADGTGYIYGAYSNDYGESFSAPVLVSGDSSLCSNTYGLPTPNGKCNENQFSDPFTGPDGALYVAYANFNNSLANASDNHNQILLVKSTDGGATFGSPVKVGDYFDLPDCYTYQAGQDAGRACVPEKGSSTNSIFRATNLPAGAANPTNANQVVVSFGSYINSDSKEPACTPAGFSPFGLNLYNGVKTIGGCKNAILLSVSKDGGATFTGTSTDPRMLLNLTRQNNQKKSDQFWQWIAFTPSGKLAVSYYDRQYGDDETTGFSDISLTSSSNLSKFSTQRVTNVSNPPPTQFSGLFIGDYSGLDARDFGKVSIAYPFWSDTRNNELFLCAGTGVPGVPPQVCNAVAPNGVVANDQDVFAAPVIIH
jgi:hypothetical protein